MRLYELQSRIRGTLRCFFNSLVEICKPKCFVIQTSIFIVYCYPFTYRWKGHALPSSTSNNQDNENQNPNLATPPSQQAKSWRAAIKSSSVKKMNKEIPRLKSTQSARNLFSGRDILGHISEFCYELKRLATRVTEREDTGKSEVNQIHQASVVNQPYSVRELELKKERKPLLEVSKDKLHDSEDKGSTFKENRRRKK